MMSQYIICHGIDLLDLEDFSKIFNNFPQQFKNVYFTKNELLCKRPLNTPYEFIL